MKAWQHPRFGNIIKRLGDIPIHTDNPFRETEDRLLFAKAQDRLKAALNKNHATFTDFMNPQRSVTFLHQFTKKGVEAQIFGGYENAERMMLGFAPPYPSQYYSESNFSHDVEGLNEDNHKAIPFKTFPIQTLAIAYNGQFSKQLTHRDFLGAVLGLGLDRGKIGDIRLGDSGAVMYVADEVANFIAQNLCEVGRTSVTVKAVVTQSIADLLGPEITVASKRITVASLRLDAVISTAFHISRGKAATLVEAEKVFVNWAIGKKTQLLSVGDTVTIRGTGRVKIDEICGQTKKDKIAIIITLF